MKALRFLSVFLGLAISSGSAVEAAPSVDAILQRWVEAEGGRAALEKLKTRTASGTLEVAAMGMTGEVVYKAKAPDRRATQVTVPGWGVVREGFDGKVAWVLNPGAPATRKSGKELVRARRDAAFHRELRFKEIYPKTEVIGAAKVGERDAWVIRATPVDGEAEKFSFDAESGLLLKQESSVETPMGTQNTAVLFEDYRVVEGLKMPFVVRMVQPQEMAFTLRFSEVRHNVTIPDTEFTEPQ